MYKNLRSEFEGMGNNSSTFSPKLTRVKNDLYILIDARATKINKQFDKLKEYQLNAEQQQSPEYPDQMQ